MSDKRISKKKKWIFGFGLVLVAVIIGVSALYMANSETAIEIEAAYYGTTPEKLDSFKNRLEQERF